MPKRVTKELIESSRVLGASVEDLDPRELKFCVAYMKHGNARQADIDAGYSVKAAGTEGPLRLRKPWISAYIAKNQVAQEAKYNETQARILKELENLAFANIADLMRVDEDGLPVVDMSNATREQLAAVTRVTNKKRKVYNSKGEHIATEEQAGFVLADKYKGLELLGRQAGLFRNEDQRVVHDVADRLLKGRAKYLQVAQVTDITDGDTE